MGTIVVGVNGSEESHEALRWSVEEARLRQAVVEAVHVWQYPADYAWHVGARAPGVPVASAPVADRGTYEKLATERLGRIVDDVVGVSPSVPVEHVVAEGSIVERLVQKAKEAELLVVGSRGRGGFRGLLLGSVGQQCAHHTSCPLVIVRRPADGPRRATGTIVVGVDGSPNADAALEWAFAEAERRGARVLALLAWSPLRGHELAFAGETADGLEARAKSLLHEAVTRAGRRGVEWAEVVEEGPAAAVLVEAAADAQLLVVGTRGRGGFTGLLLGSVGQQCVHHARCPSVIVPMPARS